MPRFVVETTEPFDDDLRAAASWRLTNVGLSSAARFLDAYDALVAVIGEFPLMAGSVEGALYHWRALERYVAVYVVDEDARMVTRSCDSSTYLLTGGRICLPVMPKDDPSPETKGLISLSCLPLGL